MPRKKRSAGPRGEMNNMATDTHAAAAANDPRLRAAPHLYRRDPIDEACVLCVPVWVGDGWTHDQACLLRGT
jgi:hypothetical protein